MIPNQLAELGKVSQSTRQSQVNEWMKNQGEQIDSLENNLSSLVARLDPILRSEPSQEIEKTAAQGEVLVPLASGIRSHVYRLGNLNDIITDILRRIEL